MSDDWNLKDRKAILGYKFKGSKTTDIPEFGFYENHIETLHQKLIEDIDSIDCTDKSKLTKWQIIEEVLEKIDKRFGVK